MVFVPDYKVGTLLAGLLTLAAGAALIGMSPRNPLHRAAGLFFALRGGLYVLVAFSSPATDLQGRLLVYPLLALPAAAVWLTLRFRQEFGRRLARRTLAWWRIGLVAVTALLCLVYMADRDAFFGGPLWWFFNLQFAAYAAIAWAVKREYMNAAEGPSRRALLTFALGVAAEPAFFGAFLLSGHLQEAGTWPAILLAAVTLLGALAAIPGPKAPGRDIRLGAALVGTGVVTGILCYAINSRWQVPVILSLQSVNAFWTTWAVGAAAYASVRYRLFSIDLHVKAVLRYGSTTFLLAALFWVTSESIEARVDAANVWESLGAAAAVAVALYPLQRLMRYVAERIMPGVAHNDAYRRRRREEIYVAALERARLDGFVDVSEREALTLLGRGLGLSPQDLTRLERVPSVSGARAVTAPGRARRSP